MRLDLIADVEAKAFPNNNVPAWSIPLVQHLLDRLGALVDDMRGIFGNRVLRLYKHNVCHLLVVGHIPLAGVRADVHHILSHIFV